MDKKGFFEFFGGMFFGAIVIIILIVAGIYVFGPRFIPKTPCIASFDCEPQKVCCTWRCDSKSFSWWKCPDRVCDFVGNEEPKDCECKDFKCKIE